MKPLVDNTRIVCHGEDLYRGNKLIIFVYGGNIFSNVDLAKNRKNYECRKIICKTYTLNYIRYK